MWTMPLVAEPDEVLDREARAERLVGHHAVDAARCGARRPIDDARQRARRAAAICGRGQPRRDEDEPVGAVLEQRLEHRALALLARGRR